MRPWRLLLHPHPVEGARNMAIDETLFHSVLTGGPPALRLYAWQPPTLSLGRGQPLSDVDQEALQAHGYGLVRRPTGGRAVLHANELTYCVVTTETEAGLEPGLIGSYRGISSALLAAFRSLGLEALEAEPRPANHRANGPVCFEVPSDYEITCQGRKLVGSAQMRSGGALLQHGAIPLTGDLAAIAGVLATRPDPAAIRARTITVSAALGRPVSWEEMAQAVCAGFRHALGIILEADDLSPAETARAAELTATKYAHPDWTGKVP